MIDEKTRSLLRTQQGELDAAAKYEHLIPDFPEVGRVRDDETRRGNIVIALLKE